MVSPPGLRIWMRWLPTSETAIVRPVAAIPVGVSNWRGPLPLRPTARTQNGAAQIAPFGQANPQLPQCFGSRSTSTQRVPQRVKPFLQAQGPQEHPAPAQQRRSWEQGLPTPAQAAADSSTPVCRRNMAPSPRPASRRPAARRVASVPLNRRISATKRSVSMVQSPFRAHVAPHSAAIAEPFRRCCCAVSGGLAVRTRSEPRAAGPCSRSMRWVSIVSARSRG